MPAAPALLAVLALAARGPGAAPGAPAPPPVATYELLESWRSVTPAGETAVSAGGTVTVRGPLARWDLAHGTFPRSSASSAIAGKDGVTLLDRKEKVAADATAADFVGLFQGRPSDAGAAAPAVRDASAALERDGAGRPFEGRPTSRFRLSAAWTVVLANAGRITRVKTEVSGVLETADLPEARSAFDSPGRLLPARGQAREALEKQVSKAEGVPIFVEIVVTSTSSAEAPGMPSGTEAPPRPLYARSTVTRRVKNFSVREGREGDEALLAVPNDFHTLSLGRLVAGHEIR